MSLAAPNTYWTLQQNKVQRSCTFVPTSASNVSTVVLIAQLFKYPFAVKSGGHAAFAGASNIEKGIMVDLVDMNERKLSTDGKTVAIGPGNRWFDDYDFLTPYDLAFVGGRVSII